VSPGWSNDLASATNIVPAQETFHADTRLPHPTPIGGSRLNAAEDFTIGVELGAYDEETARRVGGWRLARLLNRHLHYVDLLREDVGEDAIYRSLQTFVEDFLATYDKQIDDIPMLIGHTDPAESTDPATTEGAPR
jgi:hypothetical protein